MCLNPQFSADLVTFAEEFLMEKFTFCAVSGKLGLPILITIDYSLLG